MQQGSQPRIREVWNTNLEDEFRVLRQVAETHPYISMDTEFPGVVARPIGNFKTMSEYHYQTMRCNVDLLKLVQFGITLADEDGNYHPEGSTWQFNFRFSVNEDMYSPEFVELLQKSGIDLSQHEEIGILASEFGEQMVSSGLVLSKDITWISFHSGYDFGYFLRALSGESLPMTEDVFSEVLRIWFPVLYDTRYILSQCKPSTSKGLTLNDMADELGIQRVGSAHQAGPDSLLISDAFFKLRQRYSPEGFSHKEFNGKMYGFGQTATAANGLADPARGGATTAEREDRTTTRDVHNQTPGPAHLGLQLQAGIPTQIPPTQYGPMGANGPPYLRTSLVSGR